MLNESTIDLGERLASAVESAAASVVGIERRRGWGASATVWNDKGLLIAADHAVVGDSGSVVLPSGDRAEAEVIGRDPGTDIALLRVKPTPELRPLAFRDLEGLKVGHAALALGRPGKVIRASFRIIGVIGPEVRTPGGGRLEPYVETDRGLPRGFSGGPLLDIDGRGIGVNTSGLLRGADLAVTAATLTRIVGELEQHGAIRRGYLGIGVQRIRLPRPLRDQRQQGSGVLVVAVEDDSPAARAGLFLGDVVLSLSGDTMRGPDELRVYLLDHAGQTVEAEVLRAGAIIKVSLAIGERGR